MAMLIAGIIAYNEEKLLPMCIESIIGKVDEIVVVEGRIDMFPPRDGNGWNIRSSDRTIEIAHGYGCNVITSPRPWTDEATMRNQYLIGNDGDWYITIDADEKCMTELPDINDFPNNIDAYSVYVKMIGDNTGIWRPRLFRHNGTMEYRTIHDALFSDDKLISRPSKAVRLHSIWFAHYQMKRDELRRIEKDKYYKDGYTHEPEYRKEWSMFNAD